jgi:hypothetical protein
VFFVKISSIVFITLNASSYSSSSLALLSCVLFFRLK